MQTSCLILQMPVSWQPITSLYCMRTYYEPSDYRDLTVRANIALVPCDTCKSHVSSLSSFMFVDTAGSLMPCALMQNPPCCSALCVLPEDIFQQKTHLRLTS